MGFADMSIVEIAEDCKAPVATVLAVCDRLGIRYQDAHTKLALEDAKAVMLAVMAQSKPS